MHAQAYGPEEFSSFVGRTAEVAELRELLRTARAVTLCGTGGIGKTRLASRLLAAVADDYEDGAWFAELGEVSWSEQVVNRVAEAVGVRQERDRPLLDTLADVLRHRRAILVLDNCEHVVDACATLCQRLLASSPGLQVVATSRQPLRVAAEIVWPVPPLQLPTPVPADEQTDPLRLSDSDAVRLFLARARSAVPGFALSEANAADIAAICRALDGLPLAIELAAAWVRVLSVHQIADRLGHRLRLLTSTDRSVPVRQRTLRAAFDWSYDLLSGPEQILLRRLSVLAGWQLEIAEQVCADDNLPATRIVDLLEALVDKSLVELAPEALGQARYRMLETVRAYAADLLTESGEADAILQRRRDVMLRECERTAATGMARSEDARTPDASRLYDLASANLTEVLRTCLGAGDAESGLRLCTAMQPIWIARGVLAEGADWYDRFLALPAASVPAAVRGPALASRAQLALVAGFGHAEELALAGLTICEETGQRFWVAAALNLLAEVALRSGRIAEAATRADDALGVARQAGDRFNAGYALSTMSGIAARSGKLIEAQSLSEEALAVMRSIGHTWGSAHVLLGLGDLARLRDEPDAARDYYLEALTMLRQLNARPDMARCHGGLGRIAMGQRDLPAARQHLTESLRLTYASGSRIGIARSLEALARLAGLTGNADVAVQLAGAAAGLREQAHFRPMPGERTQPILDAAAGLGDQEVARLWALGMALTPSAAVRLALGEDARAGGDRPASETASGQASGPPVQPPGQGPGTALTRREEEVAGLLAAGLSNRDIARKLVISPATAAHHVASILAKLGFSSRSQVAAWAASRTLDEQ
jgi:predicted ATPase/DNA-binding CsgD family transcriptional regulator